MAIKLSIITINYNNAAGLKKTLDSVALQTYTDFEHVIVDGASTDGSVDVIREYEQSLASRLSGVTDKVRDFVGCSSPLASRLKWISEKDTGIYNAMNKGIKMANGEYLLFLNSGDYLVDEKVVESITLLLDGTDIIQGNVITMQNGAEEVKRGYGNSNISFIDAMGGLFLHQAAFCKRNLFDKYGYYDESFRINGDTVFFAKCLALGNATFKYIDMNITFFDTSGISSDPDKKWVKLRQEEDERYREMFSSRMWDLHIHEAKKIKLYNLLHSYRWSWNITMIIVRICKFFLKR